MAFEHEVTAEALRAALDQLEPSDRVIPNEVKNLAVFRGDLYIGMIDFNDNARVMFWDEPWEE
jgi:hypothetical protein